MGSLPVTARPGVSPQAAEDLASDLDGVGTLHQLLAWASRSERELRVEEIVTQDEYTHDVIVPWGAGYWLVFDCT